MDEAYELVKRNQQNNELLQILSHDVATPLSVVQTHSSIVLNKMENGQEGVLGKAKAEVGEYSCNSVTSLAGRNIRARSGNSRIGFR